MVRKESEPLVYHEGVDTIPIVLRVGTFDSASSSSSDESTFSDWSKDSNKGHRGVRKPNRLLISLRNWLSSIWGTYQRGFIFALLPRKFIIANRSVVEAFSVVAFVLIAAPTAWACLWTYNHSMCFAREAITSWQEGVAHTIQRDCTAVDYNTLLPTSVTDPSKICITTLTDTHEVSSWRRLFRCRNFDNVASLTWPNHAAYAARHGYTIIDQSHLLDPTRPPAWSKIRAVQSMFDDHKCEWVMWLDADTVVMDSSRRLESILPDTETGIDLVVTTDRRFTANSGAWILRNTDWSQKFLREWWDMRGYVRASGLSLSGDNDAFGALIRRRLGLSRWATQEETIQAAKNTRIRMPPRCNFNSFGVFVPQSSSNQMIDWKNPPEWYLSEQFYHQGDFIAHASGIDQKAVGVELLLQHAS